MSKICVSKYAWVNVHMYVCVMFMHVPQEETLLSVRVLHCCSVRFSIKRTRYTPQERNIRSATIIRCQRSMKSIKFFVFERGSEICKMNPILHKVQQLQISLSIYCTNKSVVNQHMGTITMLQTGKQHNRNKTSKIQNQNEWQSHTPSHLPTSICTQEK